MPLAPGDVFAGYSIVRELGRGGMGTVYLARHPRLPRDDALKLLHPTLTSEPTVAARFLREAEVVAGLTHRNIVQVLDRGEEAGQLWLSMQYVDGADVEDALTGAGGRLPPRRALYILTEVATALDFAHRKSVLHRDVKPSNILLSRTSADEPEQVFLTDFGIARLLAQPSALTGPGAAIGTLAYQAPEALESHPLSPSSDLYSLGCVLFRMLTGRDPYPYDSLAQLLYAHLHEAPPRPSGVVAGLPRELDEVLFRALAKDPADRYATCRELAAAAAHALEVGGTWPAGPLEPAGPLRGEPGRVRDTNPVPVRRTGHTIPIPRAPSTQSAGRPSDVSTGEPRPPVGAPRRSLTTVVPTGSPPPPDVIRLPLRPDFAFIAGPLPPEYPVPLLDHQSAVDELRDRLLYSPGGAILLTGFPGAGKTTVVDRAIGELRVRLAQHRVGDVPLVDVRLNVARPIQPEELLVKLIRNLYEALDRADVLGRLPPPTREQLALAYQRTSQSLTEIRTRGGERGGEIGLTGAAALSALATPAIRVSARRTYGQSAEASYLTYTLADAEHDFDRIVHQITQPAKPPAGRSWLPWRRPVGAWSGRLVVVLDELDKLTTSEGGEECLTALLTTLKNLFTAEGIHFVFVAGPDVTDLARADNTRGIGIFDSVFSATQYLPCVSPEAARTLIQALSVRESRDNESICGYLTYKSRGLPRLLLATLSAHVTWMNGHPTLAVEGRQALVVDFFAALNRRLSLLQPRPTTPLSHPIDHDRFRMGAYLVTDWTLRRGSMTFTSRDVEEDAELRPDRRIVPPELLEDVLAALAHPEVGILERWNADRSSRTLLDVAASDRPVYKLSDWVTSAATRTGQLPSELGRVGGGRYVLLEELGRGGLGRSYKARDERDGSLVAVKLLDIPELAHDEVARQRLIREAAIVERLAHPALVRGRGAVHEPDGTVGLVSEFVDGPSLSSLLTGRPLPGAFAVAVGLGLSDLLVYLADEGVARLDLKPSNIVLRGGVGPVVIDLGLATRLEDRRDQRLTQVGTILGTPRYAAPEQLRGETVDIRGDLYSMGLILYEVLAGTPARSGQGVEMMIRALTDRVDVNQLPCSAELRRVIAAATEPDPGRRASTAWVLAALRSTPEAHQSVDLRTNLVGPRPPGQ